MKILAFTAPSIKVKAASWDVQPRLPYNPNAPKHPKKLNPLAPSKASTLSTLTMSPPTPAGPPVSEILRRHHTPRRTQVMVDNTYMGYDEWLPNPPPVEKPRSIYNAASLAYIGDCIYELYARRHFLFPPLSIEEYNDRVMSVVRCEAQDELLQKLLGDKYLTADEKDVLRWGKNVTTAKSRTKKRAGNAVYNRASSLETLIGYLYLTNVKRLEDVMSKLGFSTVSSSDSLLEEAIGNNAAND